jgi:hypothetical protein
MITILRRRVARKLSRSAVQRTVTLPCLSLELSHFELCMGHNSETTKDILCYVQNLVGGITRFNRLLFSNVKNLTWY